MLWGQITVFYYFASLLCILFISVVLPSFGHFFQKPYAFLPAICILGKTTNRYNVLLPTFEKISPLYSCHGASFINLELKAETPLTVLIFFCSLSIFAVFQNQRFYSWTTDRSWWPPPTNHQLNNRIDLDRMKVGHIRLLNRPETRKGNSTLASCPLSIKPPARSVRWCLACLH